jgi:hypothetical protein
LVFENSGCNKYSNTKDGKQKIHSKNEEARKSEP